MKKILTIAGARPQFIKAAILSRELEQRSGVKEILLHTGQHYDDRMSDIFFREMKLRKPDHNLGISSSLQGEMTGRMLEGIERIMLDEKPDAAVVFGDTNSTIAGALAAAKLMIPLVHVEAGLRSFDRQMPEEINRVLTDRLADLLCCPTPVAAEHCRKEGLEDAGAEIVITGDIMLDAMQFYRGNATLPDDVKDVSEFVLCTFHRAGNTDDHDKLKNIVEAVNELHRKIPVVLPLHPRTGKNLKIAGLRPECIIIPPASYFEMLGLLQKCMYVITDSGGLQKEAYFCRKHAVVLRDRTEWEELASAGYVLLAGTEKESILKTVKRIDPASGNFDEAFYGDGTAGKMIADKILSI